jgi:hypothetical protein
MAAGGREKDLFTLSIFSIKNKDYIGKKDATNL